MRALFQRPFLTQTTVVLAYGLAWGIVNWGFISFLPTFLRGAGFSAATSSYLLFLSAFVAIPGTILVAYAYGMWSTRRGMMLFALASIACAVGLRGSRRPPPVTVWRSSRCWRSSTRQRAV